MKAFLKLLKCIKVLVFIFTCLIYKSTNAQYAIAGNTVGIYTDISDTILTGSNYPYINIDINQDGTDDIQIGAFKDYSDHTHIYSAWAYAIDSNIVKFSFLRKHSCFPLNLLKPYNYGDTIKRAHYIGLRPCLALEFENAGSSYPPCIDKTFGVNNYIGFRYTTNIDTAYGWIGVDVLDYGTVRVKDFALEKFITVGLHEVNANDLHVIAYPNPAQTHLYIKTDAEISEIKILNITGSELITTTQSVIDVSALPNGIYFVQIKTSKGVGARKIVVQH